MWRRRQRQLRFLSMPPITPPEEILAMFASQTPDTGQLPPCGAEEEEGEEPTVQPGDTDHCEREEVTHHQAERVDKRQLVSSEEGEDDTMEHSTEQKKHEHKELTQIPSSEEDEPKAKAKLDTSTVVSKDEARTCMLCSEPYEGPVVMECGHRFCCSCINKSGASPDSLSCPDCNKVIMEKKPITDLVSESMANPTASAAPVTASAARTVNMCPEHDEILKMYCEDDDSLCCTICPDSLKHSGHTFLNVVDAMKVCHAKLSNTVSPLEETLKKIDDLNTQQSEQMERLENTMTDCRQRITSEFGYLYKFLQEQKEKLLEQLKEKNQRLLKDMESNAAKMVEKRDSLREAIAVANEKAMDSDPYSFLDGIKDVCKTCRKQNESSSSFTITEEELCRATFQGPIQYIAWMQMKSIVPAPTSKRRRDQSRDRKPEDGGKKHGVRKRSFESGDSTVSTMSHIVGRKAKAPVSERPSDQSLNRKLEDGGKKHGERKQSFQSGDSTVFATSHIGGQKANAPASKRPRDQSRVCKPVDGGQTHGDRELSFKSDSSVSAKSHIGGQKANAPVSKRPRDQSRDRKPEDGRKKHRERKWSFESGDSTVSAMSHIGGQKHNAPASERLRDQSRDREPEDGGQTYGDRERSFESDKGLERPIVLHNSVRKEIWLLGTGYLNAVRDVAKWHPLGINLGFHKSSCKVRWFSVKTSCKDLIHSILIWCRTYGSPDVLFFYFDSRDIKVTRDNFNSLFNYIQKDLNTAADLFPKTEFILSALYPNADELQDHFYSSFAKFAQRPRFSFFRFTELEKIMEARGKEADLKILTSTELDLFCTSVRNALQDAVDKEFKLNAETEAVDDGGPEQKLLISAEVLTGPRDQCLVELSSKDDPSKDVAIEPAQPSARKAVESLGTKPKLIWIVGNGFMDSARDRAESSSLGLNLGFEKQICTIIWKNADYTWINLYTSLKQMSQNERKPDVLLLHCGDSDLGQGTENSLNLNVQNCLNGAAILYPFTEFVLSQLVPEPQKWTPDVDPCRKELNYCFTQVVQRPHFHLLRHYDLEKTLTERFSKGCISDPTDAEIDLFLSDIRSCLQETIFQDYKPSDNGTLSSGDKQIEGIAIVPDGASAGPSITRCKDIWIFGCGFMTAANHQAETGPLGFNLGFDTQTCMIHWGQQEDSPQPQFLSNYSKRVDIVLIYMGNLDVEKQELNTTKKKCEEIFDNFEKFYPNAEFIISTLLPKSILWPGANFERRRKGFNAFLTGYVEKPRFHLLRLDEIEKSLFNRLAMGSDCCLNAAETDLFITRIRDALLKAMNKDNTASIENCETLLSGDAPSEKSQLQGSVKELPSSAMEVDAAVKVPENVQPVPPMKREERLEASTASPVPGNVQPVMPMKQHKSPKAPAAFQERKKIWIIGDNVLRTALEDGKDYIDKNLGFDERHWVVWWMNHMNSRVVLLSKMCKLSNMLNKHNRRKMGIKRGSPNIVYIHVGSNDLEVSYRGLIKDFTRDLRHFALLFPETQFILSTILPKAQWLLSPMEESRKRFNAGICKAADGFLVHDNGELEEKLLSRFRKGSVFDTLNDREIKTFLKGIKLMVERAMLKLSDAVITGCETLPSGDAPSEKAQLQGSVTEQSSSAIKVDAAVKVPENVQPVPPMKRDEKLKASTASPGRKEIWITGDNVLRTALAEGKGYFDENLGFDERHWVVRWIDDISRRMFLLSEMREMSKKLGRPKIVYIYVGSNDLWSVTYQGLIEDFTRDLRQLALLFPKTQFILSTILPKAPWLISPMEESRKRFNAGICKAADGFLVHDHGELEDQLLSRFQKGPVIGMMNRHDIKTFFTSIKLIVERAMLKLSDAVITSQEPHKQVLSTGGTPIVVPETQCPAPVTEKTPCVSEVPPPSVSGTQCPAPMTLCGSEEPPPSISGTQCPAPMTEKTSHGSEEPPPSISGAKQIWIVGNSFISRAAAQAKSRSYGSNFGFEKGKWVILWMGHVGMRWEALVPELTTALFMMGPPIITFIHLGDNDLGNKPYDTFMKAMKEDLTQISKEFPNTEFVFSTILPRAEWLTNGVEQQRQEINGALMEYAADVGFHVAVHEDIEETAIPRFKSGGSGTISDSEFDLFLKGIKDAMEVMIQKVENPQTDEFVS